MLGHLISTRGIEVDNAEIQVIEKRPSPVLVKRIRSFLGHVELYLALSRIFPNLQNHSITCWKRVFIFTFLKKYLFAFNTLKEKLVSS